MPRAHSRIRRCKLPEFGSTVSVSIMLIPPKKRLPTKKVTRQKCADQRKGSEPKTSGQMFTQTHGHNSMASPKSTGWDVLGVVWPRAGAVRKCHWRDESTPCGCGCWGCQFRQRPGPAWHQPPSGSRQCWHLPGCEFRTPWQPAHSKQCCKAPNMIDYPLNSTCPTASSHWLHLPTLPVCIYQTLITRTQQLLRLTLESTNNLLLR
jgi:hypothetical protein